MGESRTCITTVKNGFTKYNNCFRSNFLSGRTLSALIGNYNINLQNLILEDGIQSFNLNYNDYLKYSLLKTRKDTINFQGINLNSKINNLKESSSGSSENLRLNENNKNEKMNYFHLSFLPYLLSYLNLQYKFYHNLFEWLVLIEHLLLLVHMKNIPHFRIPILTK